MVGALFYLQFHTIKNRLIFRFKRLRQPKYLFGAVVGAGYFCYFLSRSFGFGRFRRTVLSPETALALEYFGALALFTLLLLGWFIPRERAALSFTEAEVAFLFPAPVTRRNLIHFRLLRAQAAIFFGSCILTLLSGRLGGHAWIRGIGWWMILSLLNLHLTGAAFARTRLLDRGITTWYRRLIVLALLAASLIAVGSWARRSMPAPDFSQSQDYKAIQGYVVQALSSGPAKYLLFPLRLVVRPYLSPDALAFVRALGPALLVLLLHYAWVIRSDVAFEEASVEASRKLAERIQAMRAGQWRGASRKLKRKRAPFDLQPVGLPSIALFWKNLIGAGQGFSPRIWISLLIMVVAFSVATRGAALSGGLQAIIGMVAGLLLLWSLLLGPQVLRFDFRQDVALVDMLKTYPLPGWQIALGEVLAPAMVLAAAQWLLLLFAVGFASPEMIHGLTFQRRFQIAAGAAFLLPALDLLILQIPNAAVLMFPAWFQGGKDAPHGLEATGQRIIVMLGSVVTALVSLIPAGIVFAIVFALMQMATNPFAAFPVASAAAAVVLLAEAAGGIALLGILFERFDFSAET